MENFSENSLEQNQKNFLTNQLPERYGLGKSTCYDRMKVLHIQTFKEGGRACISPEHLQLMDDLDAYLKAGKGEIREFVQQYIDEGRIVVPEEPQPQEEPETETTMVAESEAIAKEEPETEAIVVAENQAVATSPELQQRPTVRTTKISPQASQHERIANMQAAKGARVRARDLQAVHENARDRAFAMEIAEESLISIYRASDNFTPEQKEELEQHLITCSQLNGSRRRAHEVNDFLSEAMNGLVA